MDDPTSQLERALRFASQGWAVLPLVPNGKIPLTRHGYKDATIDVTEITDHWQRSPKANIGIVTGHVSGLVVLDIDRKHGVDGAPAAAALSLPPTFTVRTASGGFHAYFRLSTTQKIGRSIGAAPGLDVLGDGGYVVAPGARIDENEYRIVRDIALAPCPDCIQQLAIRRTAMASFGRPAASSVLDDSDVIAAGGRNRRLASIAGALRKLDMTADEIADALLRINANRCNPPLPPHEVRAIASSIARYPSGQLVSIQRRR